MIKLEAILGINYSEWKKLSQTEKIQIFNIIDTSLEIIAHERNLQEDDFYYNGYDILEELKDVAMVEELYEVLAVLKEFDDYIDQLS